MTSGYFRDTDDILERIKELEWEKENDPDFWEEADLQELKEVYDELPENAFLIHVSNFTEYAEEYATSVENIPEFILPYVDFDAFADDLEMDYTNIEILGESYLYRED